MEKKNTIRPVVAEMFYLVGLGHFVKYYLLAILMLVGIFLRLDTIESEIRLLTAIFSVASAVLYPFSIYAFLGILGFFRPEGDVDLFVIASLPTVFFLKFLMVFLKIIVKYVLTFGFAFILGPVGLLYLWVRAVFTLVENDEREPGRLMLPLFNVYAKLTRQGGTFKRDKDGELTFKSDDPDDLDYE